MDPNEALRELKELAQRVDREGWVMEEVYDRMAELVTGLDGWLSNGGALPSDWCGGSGRVPEHVAFAMKRLEGCTELRISRCDECPFIKKDPRGWSQGECEHPEAFDFAPDGNTQTFTLNNRPKWCPFYQAATVLEGM